MREAASGSGASGTRGGIGARPELLFRESSAVSVALVQSLARWSKLPVQGRWLVNSHPKSGTFLPRNILMHFNSAALHQHILFYDSFRDTLRNDNGPRVYTGHVPYRLMREALGDIGQLQFVLLLRHPCSIALALARAFYDRNSTRPDHIRLRGEESFEGIVAKVIAGYECAGMKSGPLIASLGEFAVEWFENTSITLRHEELTNKLAGPDDELVAYFAPLIEAVFGRVPDDAAVRIRAGADTTISATYSRTAPWASQDWTPADVYALLPHAAGNRLRDAARRLGYAE